MLQFCSSDFDKKYTQGEFMLFDFTFLCQDTIEIGCYVFGILIFLDCAKTQLQSEYVEVAKTAAEQKALITQLEEDLRHVNALSAMFRGEGEGTESTTPTAEMVAEAVKEANTTDSLLPIVQSQRERYRVRAQELEAQTIGQQQQITMLQNEIDKLRSDNVKLYEKVRYLQSAGYTHK
ncbi:CASP-like protein, partial [Mya arenaria]